MFCEAIRRGPWERMLRCNCHNYKTIRKEIQDKNWSNWKEKREKSAGKDFPSWFFLSARHDRGFGITQRNFHSEKRGVHVSFIDQTNPLGESVHTALWLKPLEKSHNPVGGPPSAADAHPDGHEGAKRAAALHHGLADSSHQLPAAHPDPFKTETSMAFYHDCNLAIDSLQRA